VLQALSPEYTFDGASAQMHTQILLSFGCYITGTAAFWQLCCQHNMLHCCSICFVGPARSGLVFDVTQLLMPRHPSADKGMPTANLFVYFLERQVWLVVMKVHSFPTKFLIICLDQFLHHAVELPATESALSSNSDHLIS
jgi:hypothetical protein